MAKKKKAPRKKASSKKPKKPQCWFGGLPQASVQEAFDLLAGTIKPVSDLEFGSPYELLVAVVLSAQATDTSVNAATRQLFPVANTPAAMVELGVEGVKEFIRKIGLFNGKAKNVVALSELLLRDHGGEIPETRKELVALPGVGRKSANVVLNVAFGQPTIAVDTHVHRVSNRLGIAETTKPDHTELALLERTPEEHLLNAHHYLILHGRYCCKARKPNCAACPVFDLCPHEPKVME